MRKSIRFQTLRLDWPMEPLACCTTISSAAEGHSTASPRRPAHRCPIKGAQCCNTKLNITKQLYITLPSVYWWLHQAVFLVQSCILKKKNGKKIPLICPPKPSPRLYSPNPWMVSRLKSPVYQDPLAQVKLPGASRWRPWWSLMFCHHTWDVLGRNIT